MLKELDNYDWEEVFKYATPTRCELGHEHKRPTHVQFGSAEVSVQPFTRDDVKKIIAIVAGENDESDWVGVFALNDRRFALVRAGCDYTGWG